MSTDHKDMAMRRVTVTPKMAEEFLQNAIPNRSIRNKKVRSFADDMQVGKWFLNGETLKFNDKRQLIDGQHRLRAAIRCNKSFDTFIVRGVSEKEAQLSIDGGTPRNMGDFLGFQGVHDPRGVAASAYVCQQVLENQPPNSFALKQAAKESINSRRVMLSFLQAHPQIAAMTKEARSHGKLIVGIVAGSVVAGVGAAIAIVVDQDLAVEFTQLLCTGENLKSNDPISVVRRRLIRDAVSKTKLPQSQKIYLLIKTWNYWVGGHNMSSAMASRNDNMLLKILGPEDPLKAQFYTDSKAQQQRVRRAAAKKIRFQDK